VRRIVKMLSIPSSHAVRTVHLHHYKPDGDHHHHQGGGPTTTTASDGSVPVLRELLGQRGLAVVVEGVERAYRPSRTQRPPDNTLEREEERNGGRGWRLHTYEAGDLRKYDTRFPSPELEQPGYFGLASISPSSSPPSPSSSSSSTTPKPKHGYEYGYEFGGSRSECEFSWEMEELFDWVDSSGEDVDGAGAGAGGAGDKDHNNNNVPNVPTKEDGSRDEKGSFGGSESPIPD